MQLIVMCLCYPSFVFAFLDELESHFMLLHLGLHIDSSALGEGSYVVLLFKYPRISGSVHEISSKISEFFS